MKRHANWSFHWGLPLEAAITLLLAIDPIIDPMMTLVNVHTNCAATAIIARTLA